jgi:DNA-binding GntR family transcriptional regulator
VPDHSRYLDIASQLRERIEAGEWAPGSKLPTLNELAQQFGINRDTAGRAVAHLETEGYVWAVQGRGIIVRYGTMRPRRPRGDEVKRNRHALGYSFPSASGEEVWKRHGEAFNTPTALDDSRLAGLLGVKPGTVVPRRFRVTGPEGEAPFQIGVSWIHPRFADVVADVDANPAAGEWLYRIERAGNLRIEWQEIHRARMPTKHEAHLLEIPTSLPVLEIVRIGRADHDKRPVEVTEYVIASDRVETHHALQRVGDADKPWPDDLEETP